MILRVIGAGFGKTATRSLRRIRPGQVFAASDGGVITAFLTRASRQVI